MSALKARASFWRGKRVFLTSPTSFLGAWAALSLKFLGAEVFGYGEASTETPNLFDSENLAQKISMTYGDIRDGGALRQALDFAQADVVLHLGEMGFLHEADQAPPEVFAKSVVGTALLLEALRSTASVRAIVVVGSDKVYPRTGDEAFTELSRVAAYEVLPAARLSAEWVALSYRHSFFNPEKYNKHKIALATVRLGAGIGAGDFHPRSLVYEAISAWRRGEVVELRNPLSLRTWISVLDQVNGLLMLAEKLIQRGPKLAPTYNMGAQTLATVAEVRRLFEGAALSEAEVMTSSSSISRHGILDNSLALKDLGWSASQSLAQDIADLVHWYHAFYQGGATSETHAQLCRYFGAPPM